MGQRYKNRIELYKDLVITVKWIKTPIYHTTLSNIHPPRNLAMTF